MIIFVDDMTIYYINVEGNARHLTEDGNAPDLFIISFKLPGLFHEIASAQPSSHPPTSDSMPFFLTGCFFQGRFPWILSPLLGIPSLQNNQFGIINE